MIEDIAMHTAMEAVKLSISGAIEGVTENFSRKLQRHSLSLGIQSSMFRHRNTDHLAGQLLRHYVDLVGLRKMREA